MENLAINCGDVKISDENIPPVIYRYFDNEKTRESFINGNIWFSGKSNNRYFNKTSPDPLENKTRISEELSVYSLSFTFHPTKITNYEKYSWIKIIDVTGFLNAIKQDIENTKNKLHHKVSFLSKKESKELIRKIGLSNSTEEEAVEKYPDEKYRNAVIEDNARRREPAIFNIDKEISKFYDPNYEHDLNFERWETELFALNHYQMEYLKLGQEKTNSSPEPLNYSTRTRDKNLSYSNESEWRIVLEISDFKNSKDDKFYSLEHFVKYICLCVERRITEEYCKLIGDISKGL